MLHGDVPTLFEAPNARGSQADIVLLGVPYEGILVADRHSHSPPEPRPPESLYARFGADEAPDAIRQASLIYSLEHADGVAAELDFHNISENLEIVDAGNHTLESAEEVAEQAVRSGGITIALGGDHLLRCRSSEASRRESANTSPCWCSTPIWTYTRLRHYDGDRRQATRGLRSLLLLTALRRGATRRSDCGTVCARSCVRAPASSALDLV